MTKTEFIASVIDEVTEGGQLELAPDATRIGKIMDHASKYFWQNAMDAHQTEWLIIQLNLMNTPLFKERRIIKLPKCVRAIYELKETGSNWMNYNQNVNPDYRKVNFSYMNAALSGNTDAMVTAVVRGMAMDFIRSNFVLETVAFSYNDKTNYLNIEGRTVVRDLVAAAAIDIPEEKLYENNQYFRYVVGLCRKSINRLFSVTELKLLGRAGLNMSEIKADGEAEVTAVRAEIKEANESDVGFFFVDSRYIGE